MVDNSSSISGAISSFIPAVGILEAHKSELIIRRSRFLTQTVHITDLKSARDFVETIRRTYPDATHHCFAAVAGLAGDSAQIACSDDGEPHGTAGKPMLQILLHSGIGEICSVVTRWFGGIKLGTGGLVRAYQDSVRENLATLPLITKMPLIFLELTLDYATWQRLRSLLAPLKVEILAEEWTEALTIKLSVPENNLTELTAMLSAKSQGQAKIKILA